VSVAHLCWLLLLQAQPRPVMDDRTALKELSGQYDKLSAQYDKLTAAFEVLQKQLKQILEDEELGNRQAVADCLKISDALNAQVEKGDVEVTQKQRQIVIVISEKTLFRSGQAQVTPGGRQMLQQLAKTIADMKREVHIGAHTDPGTRKTVEKGDFRLSTDRALSVLVVLAESGIARARLEATGYGSLRALAPKPSDKNRRVEISLSPAE
jgi:flagellar motor protein MotB